MSTIEDDRVEQVRRRVMAGVDTEIRGRARRIRRGLAGTGVAAVVLVLGGSLVPLLATSPGGDSAGSSADSSVALESPDPEVGDDSAAGGAADLSTEQDVERTAGDRDVIVSGSAHVVTADPKTASADLATWVEGRDGRIDARDLSDVDGDGAYASVTARVPADRVNDTIDHLDTYGTVDSVSIGNDDVTATVRDLDARISALRVSIDRLEKIVTDSSSSDELVRAEQALTDRQSQLEQLLTEQKSLGEQVALATLQVEFSADPQAKDVDPGGFRGGLVSGWNALVDTLNGLVQVVGVLLPWLGILLVLWLGYRGVRRAWRVRGERWN